MKTKHYFGVAADQGTLGVLGATIDWVAGRGRQDANCEEYEYAHRDEDTGGGIIQNTFGEGLSPRIHAEKVLSLGALSTATVPQNFQTRTPMSAALG